MRHALLTGLLFAVALPAAQGAAKPVHRPRASLEFAPQSHASLSSVEIKALGAGTARAQRTAVTDMMLVLADPAGDIGGWLARPNATTGGPSMTIRMFTVAGGRLYHQTEGRCAPWNNDIATCSADCDGGNFALRRNGSAALELLVGAVPGAPSGEPGEGVAIAPCSIDAGLDARLSPKTGKVLAIVGFESE